MVFGTPKYLVSDNGTQFTALAFKNFLEKHEVTSWYTSRYHPQANAAEAANKTIETAIRVYLTDEKTHKIGDEHLPEITCAINTSQHTSTMISPYFALYGMHMCTSGRDYANVEDRIDANEHADKMANIRDTIQTNLKKNYDRSKKRYDLRSRSITYEKGETVWVKNRVLSNAIKGITAKLLPEYKKCVVTRKIGSNSYEVADSAGKVIGIYNTDCLKK